MGQGWGTCWAELHRMQWAAGKPAGWRLARNDNRRAAAATVALAGAGCAAAAGAAAAAANAAASTAPDALARQQAGTLQL
eukprot:3185979-Pleurochrysis_carterae.AAC.1